MRTASAIALQIQAGEKVYQDFMLEASDVGGHSSRPTKNNPIVRLSAALARLGAYNFRSPSTRPRAATSRRRPAWPSRATAADMRAVLQIPPDEAAAERLWAANPGWNGMLRTTCVVTEINGRSCSERAAPTRARPM